MNHCFNQFFKIMFLFGSNKNQFLNDLKNHQNGNTDYPTFCSDCAASGIEKWVVDLQQMTCVYFDKAATEILVEKIPTA